MTDLEKLAKILEKRPVEGVSKGAFYYWHRPHSNESWCLPFEPWNSIDQAMLLLDKSLDRHIVIDNDGCRASVWRDDQRFSDNHAHGESPARAIFEAAFLSVEG